MKKTMQRRAENKARPADEAKWRAFLQKDAEAEGKFYIAVKTTRVYCRPTCVARPLRKNVAFYDTSEEAERAGFRPCKRCHPGGPTLSQDHAARVAKSCHLIETAEREPSLSTVAKAVGMSPYHFHRVFKAVTGVTPKAYALARRAERLRKGLAGAGSVTEAIYAAGFNSNSRFYAQSSRTLGMTPTDFRNQGKGRVIRFAVAPCSLGSILVAASERGVCDIMMGNDPVALARKLREKFPNAEFREGDAAFRKTVGRVVGLVEAPDGKIDLPLDIRGTAFQQRVWEALRKIPAGMTATYGEIAREIGSPRAVRAVAQACGANPLAVIIPCHRVVHRDGRRSGYHWGVKRKNALLRREAAEE